MRAPQIFCRNRLVSISAVIFALTSTLSVLALPAQAATGDAPTVSVFAGNGAIGFTGDGGPAVNASLGSLNGLATDTNGNVLTLESSNKRIRKIDSSNNISSAAGSDGACSPLFDVNLPLSCFYSADGMAVANDGSYYYSSGGGIEHVLNDGTIYHFAGKFTGFYGPYDDGPKFDERIFPTDVQIDPVTGIVYFAQEHAIRMITPSGLIQTVAGTPYVCNSGSADSGDAVGACFWVHHFVVRNGDIWFTESSSWNGPRLRYVHNGTFSTLAGNGSWGEPVLNGSATASPFQDLNAITLATDGTIYLTPMNFGRIWRITPAGIVEYVYEFEGQIDWLTTDQGNNLYAGVGYKHQVMKLAWPQTVIAPSVTSLTIDTAKPTDRMFRRGLQIGVQDSPVAIDHLEYGWAKDATATEPSTTIQKSTTKSAVLFYGQATPDSDWYLMARTVVAGNVVSTWSTPKLIHTPNVPVLLFCCDSITSGHHNDYADNGKTTCQDSNYGYASIFAKEWLAVVPINWRSPDQIKNVAFSGFAMNDHKNGSYIHGTALRGGKDACDKPAPFIPVTEASNLLRTHANSWNRLVATGGINGTNWGAVAKNVILHELVMEQVKGRVLTANECGNVVASTWDGVDPVVVNSITLGVRSFSEKLVINDPSIHITWLGYYNASGTGANKVRLNPYAPVSCSFAFDKALRIVNTAIQAGLPAGAEFVQTDTVMKSNYDFIQPLFLIQQLNYGAANPSGWPHPNRAGSQAIANLLTP